MLLADSVERRLERVLRDRIQDAPVVLVNGPRTVGKSTMLAALARNLDTSVVDLDDVAVPSPTSREEYIQRVVLGGYPLALRSSSDDARARWLRDYVDLVVSKDVLELSRIRQRSQLPQLLRRWRVRPARR